MNRIIATILTGLLAAPAFAEGDAAAGEREFNKCKSCHMIVADDGTEIVKGGKVGPNVYGVIGRQAGSYEDFRYGVDLIAAREKGLVWDAAHMIEYVQDPRAFLRTYLDDSKAKSKMAFKLNNEEDAANVVAYIESVGPAKEEAATN